jgi:hypothetical protein
MKNQKTNEVFSEDISKLSDEQYWKRFEHTEEGGMNHEISLDVVCKFKGLNGGVIYETKETAINCNLEDLETWFRNLKKVIRMLDETIIDKEVGGGL